MIDTTKKVTVELTLNDLWWIRQAVESDRRFALMRAISSKDEDMGKVWNRIADRYSDLRERIYQYQKQFF